MDVSAPLEAGSCFRLNTTGLVFLFIQPCGSNAWDVLVTAPSGQWWMRRYDRLDNLISTLAERRLTRLA